MALHTPFPVTVSVHTRNRKNIKRYEIRKEVAVIAGAGLGGFGVK
jgi:hypothetical protein